MNKNNKENIFKLNVDQQKEHQFVRELETALKYIQFEQQLIRLSMQATPELLILYFPIWCLITPLYLLCLGIYRLYTGKHFAGGI